MKSISETSRGDAWLCAIDYLRTQPDHCSYNLVVEITHPQVHEDKNLQIADDLDALLGKGDRQRCQAVAGTIFPAWEYKKYGAPGVFEVYPEEVYPEIRTLPSNSWGTYAYRLVRLKTSSGETINPLALMIEKLRNEVNNPAPKRAVYELDVTGGALSTYFPEKDHKRRMGGQCLSHISVKLGPNSELYLTAMYRYQYFVQRAFGNYLGLARLQSFISTQVGIECGPLVCHATMARIDVLPNSWGIKEIEALVTKYAANSNSS